MANNDAIFRLSEVLTKAINDDLPKILGNAALSAFKKNFQDEGFFGQKWTDVLRRGSAGAGGSRKILTGNTGDLGRSLEMTIGKAEVTISSDKIYAALHNDGGFLVVTAKMKKFFWAMHYKTKENYWKFLAFKKVGSRIKIPKRQFMGVSPVLKKILRDKANAYLAKLKL